MTDKKILRFFLKSSPFVLIFIAAALLLSSCARIQSLTGSGHNAPRSLFASAKKEPVKKIVYKKQVINAEETFTVSKTTQQGVDQVEEINDTNAVSSASTPYTDEYVLTDNQGNNTTINESQKQLLQANDLLTASPEKETVHKRKNVTLADFVPGDTSTFFTGFIVGLFVLLLACVVIGTWLLIIYAYSGGFDDW